MKYVAFVCIAKLFFFPELKIQHIFTLSYTLLQHVRQRFYNLKVLIQFAANRSS